MTAIKRLEDYTEQELLDLTELCRQLGSGNGSEFWCVIGLFVIASMIAGLLCAVWAHLLL